MNRMVIYINSPITLSWTTRSEKQTPICMRTWEVSSSMLPLTPGAQIGVRKPITSSFPPYTGQPKGRYLSTSM